MSSAMQPMYSGAAALLPCFLFQSTTDQTQGTASGGMEQAGAAVDARTAFRALLASYTEDTFESYTATTGVLYGPTNKLSVLGGVGQLYVENPADSIGFVLGPPATVAGANGRHNTSSVNHGKWFECRSTWALELSSNKTAFGCFVTDLGDLGATVVLEFLLAGVVQDTLEIPYTAPAGTVYNFSPGWVCHANGSKPFNKVRFVITQYSGNPTFWDHIGIDDLLVGDVPACTPA